MTTEITAALEAHKPSLEAYFVGFAERDIKIKMLIDSLTIATRALATRMDEDGPA